LLDSLLQERFYYRDFKMSDIDLYKVRQPVEEHNMLSVGLTLLSSFMFVVMVFFNLLNASGAAVPGIFHSTPVNISALFDLDITPAGYTFAIWGIIYTSLTASMVAIIASLFLYNNQGKLYLHPPFISPLLMGTMTINFTMNLIWIFTFDRERVVLSFFILLTISVTGISATGIMARNIYVHRMQYVSGRPMFIWGVIYRLTMNGFGMYATWTLIATLINMSVALVYGFDADMTKTCLTALSLLLIILVTWFIVENTALDKYVRYLLTPYLVVVWAVDGIKKNIAEKGDISERVEDFVTAIFVMSCIIFVVRFVLVINKSLSEIKQKVSYVQY